MPADTRFKRLNDLSEIYNQLLRQVIERDLYLECKENGMTDVLSTGDYLFLAYTGALKAEGVSMAEVARKMNIHPSTATRQVNHLLKHDLITKTTVPEDERKYLIRLTEKGECFLEHMEQRLDAAGEKIYEAVSDEEMERACAFMQKRIDVLRWLNRET